MRIDHCLILFFAVFLYSLPFLLLVKRVVNKVKCDHQWKEVESYHENFSSEPTKMKLTCKQCRCIKLFKINFIDEKHFCMIDLVTKKQEGGVCSFLE